MVFWALQNISFVDETWSGMQDLWRFFMQTVRDGRIVWVLVVALGVLLVMRKKK